MFKFFILLFLLLVSLKSFEFTTWSNTCHANSCESAFDLCFYCYGQRQCKICVNSFQPECLKCLENIYDDKHLHNLNGHHHFVCESNDELNQRACHLYCRGKFHPSGECSLVNGHSVCQCNTNPDQTVSRPNNVTYPSSIYESTTTLINPNTTTDSFNDTSSITNNEYSTIGFFEETSSASLEQSSSTTDELTQASLEQSSSTTDELTQASLEQSSSTTDELTQASLEQSSSTTDELTQASLEQSSSTTDQFVQTTSFYLGHSTVSNIFDSNNSSSCALESCSKSLDVCKFCYSERQCRQCITNFDSQCSACVDFIYDKNNLLSINNDKYLLCDASDPLQTKICNIYCRGQNIGQSSCGVVENVQVCKCQLI